MLFYIKVICTSDLRVQVEVQSYAANDKYMQF